MGSPGPPALVLWTGPQAQLLPLFHTGQSDASVVWHLALGARVTHLLPAVTVPGPCLMNSEEMHFEKQECVSIFLNQNQKLPRSSI